MTIKYIRSGSVIVLIDCTDAGYSQLKSLFQNGYLTELIGFAIEDVQFGETSSVAKSNSIRRKKLDPRSISQEVWAHARESLIFYFSRRHARTDAEDLAQETLLSIWNREDYEFDKEEDFLKVCYGFARNISQQGYRESRRHEVVDTPLHISRLESSSAKAAESRILLNQICEIGRSQLRAKDWQLIQQAAASEHTGISKESTTEDANKMRVRLHRARKRLAKLVGLDDQEATTEEEYFVDRASFLKIQSEETALIADYLEDGLSVTDKKRFESRYLVVPELRRKVEEIRRTARYRHSH